MGVWGTDIFSDDLASDICRRYRDLVGDGLSGQQATEILLDEYREILDDLDEGPVFWLALAATQWRCGRLEPGVQAQAIAAIDSGAGLDRWQEASPQVYKKRRAVLRRLRDTLLSPQPPQKRIPKRFRSTCEWEVGEIIGYRLPSGYLAMFCVIGHFADLGGVSPIFELLDWIGRGVPTQEKLESVGIKVGKEDVSQITVGQASKREYPRDRLLRLGIKLNPEQQVKYPMPFTLWRWLDSGLERWFEIR